MMFDLAIEKREYTSDITVSDALELYKRLRQRGQNSLLARLSVESRLGHLTAEQRRRVHVMLRAQETNVA